MIEKIVAGGWLFVIVAFCLYCMVGFIKEEWYYKDVPEWRSATGFVVTAATAWCLLCGFLYSIWLSFLILF